MNEESPIRRYAFSNTPERAHTAEEEYLEASKFLHPEKTFDTRTIKQEIKVELRLVTVFVTICEEIQA